MRQCFREWWSYALEGTLRTQPGTVYSPNQVVALGKWCKCSQWQGIIPKTRAILAVFMRLIQNDPRECLVLISNKYIGATITFRKQSSHLLSYWLSQARFWYSHKSYPAYLGLIWPHCLLLLCLYRHIAKFHWADGQTGLIGTCFYLVRGKGQN